MGAGRGAGERELRMSCRHQLKIILCIAPCHIMLVYHKVHVTCAQWTQRGIKMMKTLRTAGV